MMRGLRDDPNRSWEDLGKVDPYFAVLSEEQYRSDLIDSKATEDFFQTGEDHVKRLLEKIESNFGPIERRSALDFGCGVGRLVLPMAKRFSEVVGVDVSPPMIHEARRHCEAMCVKNTEFICSSNARSVGTKRFDFVHSYIVLQHIPLARGIEIFADLVDKVAVGGAGALHVIFRRDANGFVKVVAYLRKKCKPIHCLINILSGRKWNYPQMQMNHYSLDQLFALLQDRGIASLAVEMTKHTSHYGAVLLFRR
jgi:SAM-dependent methyltransferase